MKNYEEIHKESLEKVKNYLGSLEKVNDGVWSFRDIQERLLEIFPELAENEDERIKKDLLYFLNAHIGCSIAPAFCTRDIIKWVAWLEKQGDKVSAIEGFETEFERQVSYLIASAISKEYEYNQGYVKWTANALLNYAKHELEKQGWQNPADKVEPKFKVGDEIKTANEEPLTITKIDDKGYWSEDLFICDFDEECLWDLVDQKSFDYENANIQQKDFAPKSAIEAINKQKANNANKVEPKFKIGDWVIDKQDIVHQIANVIENVTNHTYGYDIVGGGYFNDNTEGVRLWTIQDAKDGDVLNSMRVQATIVFKGFADDGKHILAYCALQKGIFIKDEMLWDRDFEPCPKNWNDELFSKMKEAGYTFDFEKKELKKVEQSPTWSEEDEFHFKSMESTIEYCKKEVAENDDSRYLFNEDLKWLRSFKDRVFSQPKQEWSEEDYNEIETIACHLDNIRNEGMAEVLRNIRDKYCRIIPQTTWNPSDEQMEILQYLCNTSSHPNEKVIPTLESLYNDLKKLREE